MTRTQVLLFSIAIRIISVSFLFLATPQLLFAATSSSQAPSAPEISLQSNAADDIYRKCEHQRWIPGDCPDGSCAPDALAAGIYSEWKRQFLRLYRMSPTDFQKRISIDYMYFFPSPNYKMNLHYSFAFDWLNVQIVDEIDFYHYPPIPWPPSDVDVTRAVADALPAWRDFMAQKVSSRVDVERSLRSCDPAGMTAEWCRMRFNREYGSLVVRATRVIDWDHNQCKHATVDLITGRMLSCGVGECYIVN